MSKMNHIHNQEALDAFYLAVGNLDDNASRAELEKVYSLLQEIPTGDMDADHDYMSAAIQSLPSAYLDLIATDIVNDLIDNPIFYVIQHLPLYDLMDSEQASYLNSKVLEIGGGTDAVTIYAALNLMEHGNHETALSYLNGLEGNIYAKYLKGLSYVQNEEPENAVRHFQNLLSELKKLEKSFLPNIDLLSDLSYTLFWLDIQFNLLGLFNHLSYYKKTVDTGETIINEMSLAIFKDLSDLKTTDANNSDYEYLCANYSYALNKVKGPRAAVKFLQDAQKYAKDSSAIASSLKEYSEKAKAHDDVDAILRPLRPVKRATSVTTFYKTSRFAREKQLEDMMIEHIKYGYEIFNRKLQLYEDEHFIGRQYRLKTGRHILDLLLIEEATDTLYVVELKRNQAGAAVYHQTRNYMDLLKNETNKKVKGIICLHEFQQDLQELVKQDPEIELFTYNFNFKKID